MTNKIEHYYKPGDRVQVVYGGLNEGWAEIVDIASTSHDYRVRFEEDTDRSIWRRPVSPPSRESRLAELLREAEKYCPVALQDRIRELLPR